MNAQNSIWDKFTNMYSLQKTLRFELKPIGRTLKLIKEKNLIEEDEEREKEFNQIKKIMDDYYKEFIELCLSKLNIPNQEIEEFKKTYDTLKKDHKNEKLKEQYAKNQTALRKLIYNSIKKTNNFNYLFGKEFINQTLPNWLEEKNRLDDKKLVLKFKKWVTYFEGFFDNRKNVFSEREIPTSIIYRIVHDNLPKFLDNISKFDELEKLSDFDYKSIEDEFKSELNGKSLREFLSLNNFENCLNQSGIERFNLIVGGKTTENNVKIKGLNEKINEYSQKQKDNKEQKKIRTLKLSPLFKQILSNRESESFILEKIKDKKELFEKIDNFYKSFNEFSNKLKNSVEKLKNCNHDNVYVKNDKQLTKISQEMFGNWDEINSGLRAYYGSKPKKTIKSLMKSKYFSINEIEEGLKTLETDNKQSIVEHFLNFTKKYNNTNINLFADISEKATEFYKINRNEKEKLTEKNIETIKEFLDSIMALYHFLKPLHLDLRKTEKEKGSEALETDSDFYNDFNEVFEELSQIVPLYNKVRNYVTQKPFSTGKFKLNFENPTLANGWDLNKEKDNYAVILRKINQKTKKYDYYLGIMSGSDKKIFEKNKNKNNNNDYYEKIIYKLLPDPKKMLPKVFFCEKNKAFFKPSEEILRIKNSSSHTKHGSPKTGFEKKEFDLNDCHKMIDFYKTSLEKHEEWREFNFKFKETNKYEDLSEFYADVANQGYKLSFTNIDKNYIDELINQEKLYLFQIWNKDFSEYSKGRPNIHTIYWRELFSEQNLNDIVYKLDGKAELFYRDSSIEKKITHPKNTPIKNKNPIKNKETSKFPYDLIKDKRYSEEKFFFHCPITLNFKAKDQSKRIHKIVNNYIQKLGEKINVLGIDRGERNLAYYSLIDSEGKIIEQHSFNIISDKLKRKFNYQERLDEIEGNRDKARKNWKKIENIKEMKTGYLSQVIYNIAKLTIEHNAIIVLEDLNFGFKRGRFKIEKQIYQKFEKMLIDKMNYLIFKDRKENQTGGCFKAYQLTNKFESFKKLGKQSGIIYYVDAYKTSKVCPKTGFVNLLYPRFKNIQKSKEYLKKFKYIKFSPEDNLFELNFNYSNFFSENKNKLIRDNWSIWSNGIKLVQKRNKDKNNSWETKEINVTKELQELFHQNNIDYSSGENLIKQIINIENKSFYETLLNLIRLILKLRNSYSDYEIKNFKKNLGDQFNESNYDYILSCVKDKDGNFFDSRNAKDDEVKDADANGAYHIALKGLMLINKIKTADTSKKIDLRIDRNDYLNYIIKKAN